MSEMHHPEIEKLQEFAAGSMAEPMALAIAVHLSSCPACRETVRRFEALGGAALGDVAPANMDTDAALERAMGQLDGNEPDDVSAPQPAGDLPGELVSRLPADLEALNWRRLGRGVAECALDSSEYGFSAKLLRIQPGAKVPYHTHRGEEVTVVLKGAFRDGDEHYMPGDFAAADPDIRHRPVATEDAVCYCLTVTDAPLRLLGPIGRLVDPLLHLRARA